MRTYIGKLTIVASFAAAACAMMIEDARAWSIQVYGTVRQPVVVSGDELSNMQTVRVRLNEMSRAKASRTIYRTPWTQEVST